MAPRFSLQCIRRAREMVINTNNCGYKGEYAPNYDVRHNGIASYSSQSPQTYNHSWHVRETAAYGAGGASVPPVFTHLEERCSCSCWPRCEHYQGMRCPSYPAPPPISAASVVASYGVYHHHSPHHQDDDDGFAPKPITYKGVVVNAAGTSSVVRPTPPPQEAQPQAEEKPCGCCGCCKPVRRSTTATTTTTTTPAPSQSDESCWWSWCRPTIVLLFLVLLVIVFVLVSAILLYYNCTLHVLHVLYVVVSFVFRSYVNFFHLTDAYLACTPTARFFTCKKQTGHALST